MEMKEFNKNQFDAIVNIKIAAENLATQHITHLVNNHGVNCGTNRKLNLYGFTILDEHLKVGGVAEVDNNGNVTVLVVDDRKRVDVEKMPFQDLPIDQMLELVHLGVVACDNGFPQDPRPKKFNQTFGDYGL